MPSVETLTTCQTFNAEVCYGGGLTYCTVDTTPKVREEVEDFCFENSLADYFLGACLDFKHFGFCVSLLILSKDGKRITNIIRKEACNCRFTPADGHGVSHEVVFANWEAVMPSEIEHIALLNMINPWRDLQLRMQNGDKRRKFAIVSRIPTARNTYYPIPYYAAIFKSRWYDIKQLITTAKKAKQQMIDFLTRAENSGKVLFSEFYQTPDGTRHRRCLPCSSVRLRKAVTEFSSATVFVSWGGLGEIVRLYDSLLEIGCKITTRGF